MAPPPFTDAMAMLERLGNARGAPLSAFLEISDRCNEVCVHCYQEQGLKGEMDTAELLGVIDQLHDMGVLVLTLSGGEATLRKDFLEVVAHARARRFTVRLFTNGLNMTRELAQSLGRLAVQTVEISVYSTQADTHDFVTGVKGSFERSVAGVRHLVAAGVPVTIKTPVMSLNQGETEAYAAFATSLGASSSLSTDEMMPREGGDRAPEAFTLDDRARVEIARRRADRHDECGGDDTTGPSYQRAPDSLPCGAGRVLHVEPNGELRPCTMLELDLGHALRDGVAAAYSGNELARSLRELSWKDLHGCRECDLRSSCQRCYAAALAQAGDALGPYEGACRSARLAYEVDTGRAPRFVPKQDRNVMLGPYREIAEGTFEPFDHIITPADDVLAQRMGWVRRSSGGQPAPVVAARPGELIQIRRPGRKTSKLERIPVGTGVSGTVEVARHTTETERRT